MLNICRIELEKYVYFKLCSITLLRASNILLAFHYFIVINSTSSISDSMNLDRINKEDFIKFTCVTSVSVNQSSSEILDSEKEM